VTITESVTETTTDQHAAFEQRTVRPLGRVLVTGAASGLGRAVAAAVAAAGGSPLLLDRVEPRTDAVPALADAPAVVVDLA
jgi:NADP-dependent 3-hydroxy acid dehydrogenase YdfG